MTLTTLHMLIDDVTTHREVWILWQVIDAAESTHDAPIEDCWRLLADTFPESFRDPADGSTIRSIDYYDWPTVAV